mmetsp:Transcript_82822/g.219877  ORF Transcript_82822/g.219877 Transcript_82822/m.219877 type:complete len:203 (-) Transcript_82822:337-945(-)
MVSADLRRAQYALGNPSHFRKTACTYAFHVDPDIGFGHGVQDLDGLADLNARVAADLLRRVKALRRRPLLADSAAPRLVLQLPEYCLWEVAILGRLLEDGAIGPAFLLAVGPGDPDALSMKDADAPRYALSWSPMLRADVDARPNNRGLCSFGASLFCSALLGFFRRARRGCLLFGTAFRCLLLLHLGADGCLQVPVVGLER